MRVARRESILKDGRRLVIRSADRVDALDMIDCLKQVATESTFLLSYPDEITYTESEEISIIDRFLNAPTSAMLVAFVDNRLVAISSIMGQSRRRKMCHRAELGISVLRDYWGLGIGARILATLIEAAKNAGLEQIELGVFTGNKRALALYRKMGFVETGLVPQAAKLDDGTYYDEHRMVLMLDRAIEDVLINPEY
ncbi:MAG TPA: GNAT family N-acetyltransferase [Fastidiosipila sp.]|jgi:RimJ/RimL family protein N-acetyltransferase|nr:GNAT family N-acetyltransferase [Fastidiosipila sp.]